MERYDAIVVGVGVMGAASLAELASRGVRVLGIERFDVPHAMGSSHGATRVIRKAYFEDPAYVPLLHRAWDRWEELGAAIGERLLVRTGALHLGPSDHACIEGVRRAAREHGLGVEELDAPEVARRFPAMRPATGDVGIVERDGGFLLAERCTSALVELAMGKGAQVHARERVIAIEVGASVIVRTDRATYDAARLVLACGAWSEGDACPLPIPVPLSIERQVQLWFAPRDAALVEPDRLPVFVRFGEGGCFYGVPRAVVPGVKICAHHGGETTRAEALDRGLRPEDEARVRAFVRAHVPAADGPLLAARVCMYTNTPDDHFVIGAHPDHDERVVIACGFSGHGFKLAPVVGELIADHVMGRAEALPLFAPDRFSSSRS